MSKSEILGYTAGVFDLFHIGHVNLLRNASSLCDRLVVGVSTDELVSYKFKKAVIPFSERIEIVRACRYVDTAIAQRELSKWEAWERLKFDVLFVGDDWHKDSAWLEYETKLKEVGVKIVYLPYHHGTSSTLINETLNSLRAN
jgi:glycerol-3-phosphate cytidylyltransferase